MEVVAINSSSVTLQWSPPETLNGVITQYSMQLNEAVTTLNGGVLIHTIGRLSPDTVYFMQLRAHTGAGAGPPNNKTVVTCKLQLYIYCIYSTCNMNTCLAHICMLKVEELFLLCS